MHVLIIGAGVIGLTSAAELVLRGHRVTLVDQQPTPASGTSYANGGQLSYSHAEPWANPRVIPYLLKSFRGMDTPIRWRPSFNPDEWRWALHFAGLCLSPWSHKDDMEAIYALTHASRTALHRMQQSLGIEMAHRQCGTLHLYDFPQAADKAWKQLEPLRKLGCPMQQLERQAVLAVEPGLTHSSFQSAIFFAQDEVGDAHGWCLGLADWLSRQPGCELRFNSPMHALHEFGQGWRANLGGEVIETNACVLATGNATNMLLKPLGVQYPVHPLAGYSVTYGNVDAGLLPQASITDNQAKIVASRLGNHLRVAGMGDLGRISQSWQNHRYDMLRAWTERTFPHLRGMPSTPWTGYRPATPSGLPLIGHVSNQRGLFVNIGHGPLGWTMAAGSAAWLADLMEGKPVPPAWNRMRA